MDRYLSGMAKGLSGQQPAFSLPAVIPAQAGIQEGEAGGINGAQVLSDNMPGCHAPVWSFSPCGNDWYKPLDSSLRWAATGILGGLFPTPLYHLHPCRRVHK